MCAMDAAVFENVGDLCPVDPQTGFLKRSSCQAFKFLKDPATEISHPSPLSSFLITTKSSFYAKYHQAWVASYGLGEAILADVLDAAISNAPLGDSILGRTIAVYRTAVACDYQPLGIASYDSVEEGGVVTFTTAVPTEGPRVLVELAPVETTPAWADVSPQDNPLLLPEGFTTAFGLDPLAKKSDDDKHTTFRLPPPVVAVREAAFYAGHSFEFVPPAPIVPTSVAGNSFEFVLPAPIVPVSGAVSPVLACLEGRIARLEAMLGVPPPCA